MACSGSSASAVLSPNGQGMDGVATGVEGRTGMRMLQGIGGAVLVLAAPIMGVMGVATPAAAQDLGYVQICRSSTGAAPIDGYQSLPVPAGTGFTNGTDPTTGAPLSPRFTVHTTVDVTLPPSDDCVTATAVLDDNPSDYTLTAQYPAELPAASELAGVRLVARVEADFR
jgi:hypothetical protein